MRLSQEALVALGHPPPLPGPPDRPAAPRTWYLPERCHHSLPPNMKPSSSQESGVTFCFMFHASPTERLGSSHRTAVTGRREEERNSGTVNCICIGKVRLWKWENKGMFWPTQAVCSVPLVLWVSLFSLHWCRNSLSQTVTLLEITCQSFLSRRHTNSLSPVQLYPRMLQYFVTTLTQSQTSFWQLFSVMLKTVG